MFDPIYDVIVLSTSDLSPTRDGDAGIDLRAKRDYVVPANGHVLVETGVRVAYPMNYYGMVCSRSGLAAKHGVFVLNAPGIIDSNYRGDIGVILANMYDKEFYVNAGDRIAQLVHCKQLRVSSHVVDEEFFDTFHSNRGSDGFGSSGVA